jgi:streptogramin lyase
LACPAVLAAALLVCVLPQVASAETFALSKVAEPSSNCGVCMAIRVPTVPASSADAIGPDLEGSGEDGGLDPKDLREAYELPATGGSSQTVAVIDAYNDPYAESDLQEYRKKYKVYFKGTETACTETSKGGNGCFKKIDQAGETEKEAEEHSKAFPAEEAEWGGEISLDVDMVSAACPECHILLVEADNEELASLSAANEEAVTKKATETSNSWGYVESSADASNDKYFDHPGIPTFAAAGDVQYNGCDHKFGAGICYPAASQYAITVGGVKLTKKGVNWTAPTEEVWKEETETRRNGTGSGCSKYEPKPPGQKELSAKDSYCEHRLDNDVSADAAVESAVSVRDSYYPGGWEDFGGTSAASPFVAGVEAHATSATQLLGADAFYEKPSMLFDVTKGNNDTCTPPAEDEYFCTAETGYDGPTGEGTPDNVFTSIVPAGATGFSTKIETKGTTLNGIVNPNGTTTKYYFQYGTTESYGKATTEESVSAGTSDVEESKAIIGLTGGTKYDFRIVTTNTNGTTYGLNQVFTTLPNPPENTVLPVASPETPDRAVPESTTTGTWTNSPTGYAYQWERCNATGGECAVISGATSSKYTPVEADVGHTLVVKVTAKNSGGSNTAASKATGKVQAIGVITEYALPAGSTPFSITDGPDGALWFTEGEGSKLGRITTAGTVTEYAVKNGMVGITSGLDGDLWAANDRGSIWKITTQGGLTEYPLTTSNTLGIAAGPDGKLWFTNSDKIIGKITTSGEITDYTLTSAEEEPRRITAGPKGESALWFTNGYCGYNSPGKCAISKITTSGAVSEYTLSSFAPWGITVGPDGNLWFAGSFFSEAKIGKITPGGVITEYTLSQAINPLEITAGPDGNLWFTEEGGKIGRITTAGEVTEYRLSQESKPRGITVGPDDNIWFTEEGTNKIGKITP